MIDHDVIIRAGFQSLGFRAGKASVDITGTFTKEEGEDVVAMLEIVISSVRRQMEPMLNAELKPLAIVDDRNDNPDYATFKDI